ncbi:MAG: hypothetical protein COV66_13290 [Nitrospinae bacterium CG11_big_fil_rev_8_21_14_0_20_45_15]|nr:MAG: hypothetical protein COV66_13290 [Nitrospinae bacterium CG11_big_fil_rev_8_21_14_0_20_45_15]
MIRLINGFLTIVFVTTIFLTAIPDKAEALPAFARKHGFPCTQCHVQFPKLNKFGIAFKNRGYRLADEEGKFVWEDKVWPVAAVGRMGFRSTNDRTGNPGGVSNEFVFEGLELFSGGTLAPRVSYFIDALTVDNFPLLQFNDILPDSALNIKIGQYNVDNYALSHPRRLTFSTYLVQTTSSRTDNVTFGNQGIEINGQFEKSGIRYILGGGDGSTTETEDKMFKSFFGYFMKDFGEAGHTFSIMFRTDESGTKTNSGKSFTAGGGVQLFGEKWELIAHAYHFKGGDDLNFTENAKIHGYQAVSGTVEGTYKFTEKLLAVARYDWHDTLGSKAKEYAVVTALQYHFVPNIKLNLEYRTSDVRVGGTSNTAGDEQSLRTYLRFGF